MFVRVQQLGFPYQDREGTQSCTPHLWTPHASPTPLKDWLISAQSKVQAVDDVAPESADLTRTQFQDASGQSLGLPFPN